MARSKDTKAYEDNRTLLLQTGMELIRSQSYSAVGINDILQTSGVPRGSFYHYFASKEIFGLAVSEFYHEQQLAAAKSVLLTPGTPAIERLQAFFNGAQTEFKQRNYGDGCLMCNLSTELADVNANFQTSLSQHWQSLTEVIARCIAELDKKQINLAHLSDIEAADWLLNAWSGALVRMKATKSAAPLELFNKTIFPPAYNTAY